MKYIYIYGLIDPKINIIKYVGATNDLGQRYESHINTATYDNTKRGKWILDLKSENLKPSLILLDKVIPQEAAATEKKWVLHYEKNGLYNSFPLVPYCDKDGKTHPISLRIHRQDMIKLKLIAETFNKKYQTLIKQWIAEKINEFS